MRLIFKQGTKEQGLLTIKCVLFLWKWCGYNIIRPFFKYINNTKRVILIAETVYFIYNCSFISAGKDEMRTADFNIILNDFGWFWYVLQAIDYVYKLQEDIWQRIIRTVDKFKCYYASKRAKNLTTTTKETYFVR